MDRTVEDNYDEYDDTYGYHKDPEYQLLLRQVQNLLASRVLSLSKLQEDLSKLPTGNWYSKEELSFVLLDFVGSGYIDEIQGKDGTIMYTYVPDIIDKHFAARTDPLKAEEIPIYAKFVALYPDDKTTLIYEFSDLVDRKLFCSTVPYYEPISEEDWIGMYMDMELGLICSACVNPDTAMELEQASEAHLMSFICENCLIKLVRIPGASEAITRKALSIIRNVSDKFISEIDTEAFTRIINGEE